MYPDRRRIVVGRIRACAVATIATTHGERVEVGDGEIIGIERCIFKLVALWMPTRIRAWRPRRCAPWCHLPS